MILLTRKAEFSSSHYYWSDQLSAAENVRLFGKCANRNGHGHNYTLEVTVEGEVDPVSGFVVDLKELKDIMNREVVDVYDHRHLNLEVEEFKHVIPTTREPRRLPSGSGWKIASREPNSTASGSMRCPTFSPITTVKHESLSVAQVCPQCVAPPVFGRI